MLNTFVMAAAAENSLLIVLEMRWKLVKRLRTLILLQGPFGFATKNLKIKRELGSSRFYKYDFCLSFFNLDLEWSIP